MEREANYVAVGTFILLVIAMGVAFLLWYTDARESRDFQTYEIYFTGSVSGLERGGPVRYLGVDVGRVRRIEIDGENAGRVAVTVDIDSATPVSSATRASLGLQGITGLLYIDLKEMPDEDRTAALKQGRRHRVIESVTSDFDAFLASMPKLLSKANDVLERVNSALSDDNLEALSKTMTSLRDTSNGLPQTVRGVDQLVADMQATVKEIHGAAEGLRGIATDTRPELQAAMERIGKAAENLQQVSARMDRFAANSEVQLGHFANNGLFEMERLIRETRSAAREFGELSRSLKDNPSQLLYEPPTSGIEIAK